METIRHGFSVYFVSLPDLLDRPVQAQAENRMRKKMADLRKRRLLVLDEIGYGSLDKQAGKNVAGSNSGRRVIRAKTKIKETK